MSNSPSGVDDILRPLGLWVADCAEVALPIFEAHAPGDVRPRDAVAGIRAFGRGGPRLRQLRSLAWAAHKAGNDVHHPAATSAARAASLAAASAYMHLDVQTSHQTKHGLGPAVYAAQALEQSAAGDTRVGDDAIRHAVDNASAQVRELVRSMPPVAVGRSRLAALYAALDAGLRTHA